MNTELNEILKEQKGLMGCQMSMGLLGNRLICNNVLVIACVFITLREDQGADEFQKKTYIKKALSSRQRKTKYPKIQGSIWYPQANKKTVNPKK